MTEERIQRPFSHQGVTAGLADFLPGDKAEIRRLYLHAAMSDPRVRLAVFEAETRSRETGRFKVTFDDARLLGR